MRPIDIRIGHNDNLMIPQFFDIKLIAADPSAQCHDQVTNFLRGQHAVKPRPLHIKNLAFQRQNCLSLSVAASLGRATGAVPLHQKDFGFRRVFFRAIFQFSSQIIHIHRGFAPGQITGFTRRLASEGGLDDLTHNDLGL